MAGPEFFQTGMGKVFFEATMPGLVSALRVIAEHLSKNNVLEAVQAKQQLEQKFWERAFLASLHCVPHNALDHTDWATARADEALAVWRKRLASTASVPG